MNIEQVEHRFGPVKAIRKTAVVMHVGWEMDNEVWLVEFEDGKHRLVTTSHGAIYAMPISELQNKLKETQESADSLHQILLWMNHIAESKAGDPGDP